MNTKKEKDSTMDTMPKVHNKHKKTAPQDAIYIGRPSKWGNPFVIDEDGTREEVIKKYEEYILGNPELLAQLHELKGKDLVCFCAPKPCHGDVLVRLANKPEEKSMETINEKDKTVKKKFVIAGTGTRALINEPHKYPRKVLNYLIELLSQAKEKHGDNLLVISGMAEGFDEALARAAVAVGVPFVAAVPNPSYINYYWTKSVTGKSRLKKGKDLLDQASEVIYVCETHTSNLPKYNGRAGSANFERNEWMVDHADIVWAFHPVDDDGNVLPLTSGTKHCVNYAREKKVNVFKVIVNKDNLGEGGETPEPQPQPDDGGNPKVINPKEDEMKAPKDALVKCEKLTPEEVAWITSKLEEKILPHLKSDISNYAKGRQRVWLPFEAPLGDHAFVPGVLDGEVWQWIVDRCAKHGFKAQVALISKGGNIKPHRDTTFAAPWAMGINLGVCDWHIASARDAAKPDYTMSLSGGEVFKFNSKHVHAVTNAAPDRWAINVWAIADSQAAKNANIPERLNEMLEKYPEVHEFIDFHQPGVTTDKTKEEPKMKEFIVTDHSTGEVFEIEADSAVKAGQAFLTEGRSVTIKPQAKEEPKVQEELVPTNENSTWVSKDYEWFWQDQTEEDFKSANKSRYEEGIRFMAILKYGEWHQIYSDGSADLWDGRADQLMEVFIKEHADELTITSSRKEPTMLENQTTQPETTNQDKTRKEPKMNNKKVREFLTQIGVGPMGEMSYARVITNDPDYWSIRFNGPREESCFNALNEINRGAYHYALADHLFGDQSFCITVTSFKDPFDPTIEQSVNSGWKDKPKDAIFGYADFDAETMIYVKGHNSKEFSTLANYGLVIGNSTKMTKRLTELVKAVRGFAIHTGDQKRLRIKVLTHADILRAFPHLKTEEVAGKNMDGVSITAVETVKYVFRNNPYMDNRSKAKLLRQIEDKSVTNFTIRILTNVNGVAGLIKGNTLVNTRKAINARMRELGLIGKDEVYDVFTSVDNFKEEFGTDGSFEIITLEPHHGPGMVKTNDQMLAQYKGMKGVFDYEELLQAFDVVMTKAYNNIVEGKDIEFLDNVHSERATTESDRIKDLNGDNSISNIAKMAGTLNELGFGINVSQTIMFARSNLILNMFLDNEQGVGNNWKAPAKKKRAFVFQPHAFRAYIMTKEMVYMAGYDVDFNNMESAYHAETQTFMIPGILVVDIMIKLGGADFDDEVGVHIRIMVMENGEIRFVAFLVRTPNDWAEYWIIDVDIDNFGPVFLAEDDGIEIPTIYEKDFKKFNKVALAGDLPSKVNGSDRPTPAVWDWESTRYNYKVATNVGSGVGGQVKTKMLQYGAFDAPFDTLPCANEDMIDAIQQCKGDIADMELLNDWSVDQVIRIVESKSLDAYWWHSRGMGRTIYALKESGYDIKDRRPLSAENSPIVSEFMKPREKMIRETRDKMVEFLNRNIHEIDELSIVIRGTDYAKYRKLVSDLNAPFKTHLIHLKDGSTRKMNKDEIKEMFEKAAFETEERFIKYRAGLIERDGEAEGLVKFHKHFLKLVRMSWLRKDEAIRLNHADYLNYDRWLYTASSANNAILMDFFYDAMVWFRENHGNK